MFWNKDKKEEKKVRKNLPDLPPLPSAAPSMRGYSAAIPGAENERDEIHSLPSFPDSPMDRGFSQSAIKSAIETEDIKDRDQGLPPLPEDDDEFQEPMRHYPGKTRTIEMEEWTPSGPPMMARTPQRQTPKGNRPIFVKLDKFNDAKESLGIVKDKLDEIDDLLRTIREVKMKEDHEISSWEKEIQSVKARINSINAEIFEDTY